MEAFSVAAGIIAALHFLAGWQRTHLAIFVAATLWALYAVYEHFVANASLCDADCNIRVDLGFIFPVLGLATLGAYRSYRARQTPLRAIGVVLGAIVVFFGRLLATATWQASRSSWEQLR